MLTYAMEQHKQPKSDCTTRTAQAAATRTQHLRSDMAGLPRRDHFYMDTAKSSAVGLPDVRMPLASARGTLSNDINMNTARSGTTLKNGNLQLWERELLESSEVRRKSTIAQLCTSRYTLSRTQSALISAFRFPRLLFPTTRLH